MYKRGKSDEHVLGNNLVACEEVTSDAILLVSNDCFHVIVSGREVRSHKPGLDSIWVEPSDSVNTAIFTTYICVNLLMPAARTITSSGFV